MYGGIEAGGTKFVCAVSDEGVIVEKISIPTTAPEETLKQVFDFFDQYELEAMGIGSFGPIGIDKSTDSYGYVLARRSDRWKHLFRDRTSGNGAHLGQETSRRYV